MIELEYDLVIVGAGLVGQSLAAAVAQRLSESDVRIALVDPSPAGSGIGAGVAEASADDGVKAVRDYDLRVSALTERTRSFLSQMAVWQKMSANQISPYREMRVWDAEGTGSVHFEAADLHLDCLGHIVENSVTLQALSQRLAELPSVDRLQGWFKSVSNPDKDGRLVVELEAQGHRRRFKTQVLVGADGVHSNVRQWAGMSTREWDYQHQAIVASVRMETPLAATAWQRFRPEGPLAMLPLCGDARIGSIVWSTHPEEASELMTMDDQGFKAALEKAFESRLGGVLEVSERRAVPLRQRHATAYWNQGVVLMGDAAHSIHPLAGQGVNLGFKDAEILSEEFARAWQRGTELGHPQTLARYQRRRQTDNLTTMAAMEAFKRLFEAESPWVRLARNQGLKWFDAAMPIKQHAMMQAMGL